MNTGLVSMIVPGILVLAGSIEDIRKRSLPSIPLILGIIICAFSGFLLSGTDKGELIAGGILGGAIMLFSIFSGEKLGKADALVFIALGLSLGIWRTLNLMWLSFLAAGLTGLILIVFLHKPKNSTLPFLPFVAAAYIILIIPEVLP
ncbi:MAG: prepilin peptidase [Lachnospiraceae bacterium]|nr:prepilin peptidase [Lachnospiraceae bacterium]